MPNNTQMIDPEVREILVKYFTKVLNYTYDDSKQIRLLLKLQNLTIEDIIISNPLPTSIKQEDETEINLLSHRLGEIINPSPKKIKSTPEMEDLNNLEFCYSNLELLTRNQQAFILDNYKSRDDNAVTSFKPGILSPLSSNMRQFLSVCTNRINKKI